MVDQNTTNLFNDIYKSTNRKVLSYITSKCNNTSDISDIFQDIYMELYVVLAKRGLDYIDHRDAFVMNIAKQKIYRYYSLFDKLKSVVPLFTTNNNGEEVNIVDLEMSDFSVEENASVEVLVAQINKFISEKSQDIQKVFYLYYSLDMTIPEIARQLSMRESNVKNKLYRTLKELRKLYIGKDGTHDE
ncbi:MAG: sigma-70 family RNA polymerase sigma factor [Clostridiaceae bacterium]|nr:sigma-70 family RNA polymerase sigma factor [Clostridiaceae bacterium]